MTTIVKINCWAPTRPHANQKLVIDDPARFKLLRCGRKWRKTSLGVSLLLKEAIKDKKRRTWAFILPFQNQARDSVWNDHVQRALQEFDTKGLPYKKNDGPMIIEFPGRGRFKLYGSDNEVALRSISNWGGVVIDEFDDCKSDLWDVTVRPNLMVHKAWAIIMGTPKGKKQIYRLEKSGLFKVFHFTSYDNPDLDPKELADLIEEYKLRGDDYYSQEIMAEYRKPVGVIIDNYEPSVHVIDPITIPEHWSWFRTIDLGENNPTGCLWIAVDPDGKWYVTKEYYERGKTTEEHAENMLMITGKKRIRGTVLDENGLGKQLLLDYNRYGMRAIGQRHCSVTDGIARLKEMFRVHPAYNKPSIYLFRGTTDTLQFELENYVWDNRGTDELNAKETPLKKNDHLIDALRNFAMTFFYSKPLSAEKQEEQRRRRLTRTPKVSSITNY
jgi:hypothetical protein